MSNIRKTSIQHFIYTVRLLQKKHLLTLSLDEEDTLRQFDFHNMHDDFYSKLQNSFLASTMQERVHRFLKICEAIYMWKRVDTMTQFTMNDIIQFTIHDVLRCIVAKYICNDAIAVNFIDVSAFARFIVDESEHNELYTLTLTDIEEFLRIYK